MVNVLGVDEAGRGPVIGPMVMAGAMFREKDLPKLQAMGVKDSKLLSQRQREDLYEKILKICVSYKIIIVEPSEIDDALNDTALNLNKLEAVKSAIIINELKPDRSMLDSPGNNPQGYLDYLKLFLKSDFNVRAENKADYNYLEVAAASILAKVTRDNEIHKMKKTYGDFGPGYPSNERTQEFVRKYWDKYPEIFRKTWSTYKKVANSKKQKSLGEY